MGKQTGRIPADMEELRQQFESWRHTHAHRSRIPETLWISAVKLARQHGLHSKTLPSLELDTAERGAVRHDLPESDARVGPRRPHRVAASAMDESESISAAPKAETAADGYDSIEGESERDPSAGVSFRAAHGGRALIQ